LPHSRFPASRQTSSVKLTHFGLDFFYDQWPPANVEQLVRRGSELKTFVRVEGHRAPIPIVPLEPSLPPAPYDGAVGSRHPVLTFAPQPGGHRATFATPASASVCATGAYLDRAPSIPGEAQVDTNYIRLMQILLDRGEYPAIATHDEK